MFISIITFSLCFLANRYHVGVGLGKQELRDYFQFLEKEKIESKARWLRQRRMVRWFLSQFRGARSSYVSQRRAGH